MPSANRPEPPPGVNIQLSRYDRFEVPDLLRLAERADEFAWQPFHEGVEIFRIYGDGISGPSAALIRFREAAVIPAHEHQGYEHIFILAGAQSDQNSRAAQGTFMINPPGTRHRIHGEAGCLVLAIYQRPVRFM